MKQFFKNSYYWFWSLIHPCRLGLKEYDHDFEYVDTSFDHEFGTQQCGFWQCVNCGEVDTEKDPPTYEDYHDDCY